MTQKSSKSKCASSCCETACTISGPTGPAGPVGPQGATGATGETGESGLAFEVINLDAGGTGPPPAASSQVGDTALILDGGVPTLYFFADPDWVTASGAVFSGP